MAARGVAVAVSGAVLAAASAAVPKDDFIWGTATAAYQIEGFPTAEGRAPSVWDEFAKPEYGHIRLNASGDPADQDYVFYAQKTVPLLQASGFKHYRMSISWTRILHNQTAENPAGIINREGVEHYRKVFRALLAGGIQPVVTMWHWDTPQALETAYGGFLARELMPKFFEAYARVLLMEFGSVVRYWITLNEPLTVATQGYTSPATHAPGRCSDRSHCKVGDDRTEPYLAAHTMIVSHAHAVRVFRESRLPGVIGITLNGDFCVPVDASNPKDVEASERCMEWQSGWFFDPIYFGDYPASMRQRVGDRLPTFSEAERRVVKGSHMGVYFQNLYTAMFAKDAPQGTCGLACDGAFASSKQRDGKDIGPKSPANNWLFSYPVGFRKYINWITERYQGEGNGEKLSIIVSENGWGDLDSEGKEALLNDVQRCNFYREYIGNMSLAVNHDGADVRGYFAWSLMDNFEWAEGYTTRFGITYVDYKTQERTPKLSYKWFAKHVTGLRALPKDGVLAECQPETELVQLI